MPGIDKHTGEDFPRLNCSNRLGPISYLGYYSGNGVALSQPTCGLWSRLELATLPNADGCLPAYGLVEEEHLCMCVHHCLC